MVALAVVTVTVVGLMVGVELAVAAVVNPVLSRLPDGSSVTARADGGRLLGRVMPFWYAASLALTVALVAVARDTTTATTALAAALLLVVSVVLSVALLVPINNRVRTWTADRHPADWRSQLRRWGRLHHVRVGIVLVAFVLVVTAASTP